MERRPPEMRPRTKEESVWMTREEEHHETRAWRTAATSAMLLLRRVRQRWKEAEKEGRGWQGRRSQKRRKEADEEGRGNAMRRGTGKGEETQAAPAEQKSKPL